MGDLSPIHTLAWNIEIIMIHNRHSLRLKDNDYTQPGPYFVTTVTHERECLFGNVLDGEMQLNESGQIVADAWQ